MAGVKDIKFENTLLLSDLMGYDIGAIKNTMIFNFNAAKGRLREDTEESKKYAVERLELSKGDLLLLFKELRKQGYSSALNFEKSGTELLDKTGLSPECLYLAKIRIYGLLGQLTEDKNTQKRYCIEVVNAANKLLLKKNELVEEKVCCYELVEEYYIPDILLEERIDTESIVELVLPIYHGCLINFDKESATAEKTWNFFATLPSYLSSKL